jgi:hypothetical protein
MEISQKEEPSFRVPPTLPQTAIAGTGLTNPRIPL